MSALKLACGNSTGEEPMINRPIAHDAPTIGAIVHGLLRKLPVRIATLFKRQTTETNAARIVCNPSNGENPINVPIANASAVRSGGSSRLSRLRNALRNMTSSIIVNHSYISASNRADQIFILAGLLYHSVNAVPAPSEAAPPQVIQAIRGRSNVRCQGFSRALRSQSF